MTKIVINTKHPNTTSDYLVSNFDGDCRIYVRTGINKVLVSSNDKEHSVDDIYWWLVSGNVAISQLILDGEEEAADIVFYKTLRQKFTIKNFLKANQNHNTIIIQA